MNETNGCFCNEVIKPPFHTTNDKGEKLPVSGEFQNPSDKDAEYEQLLTEMLEAYRKEFKQMFDDAGLQVDNFELYYNKDYDGNNNPRTRANLHLIKNEILTVSIDMLPNSWFFNAEGKLYSFAHELGHVKDMVQMFIEAHKTRETMIKEGLEHCKKKYNDPNWQPSGSLEDDDMYKEFKYETERGKYLDNRWWELEGEIGSSRVRSTVREEMIAEQFGL